MALRSVSSLRLLPLLLASLIIHTTAQRNCWFPDGNTETPDVPCNPNAAESACCGPNAFCLSNGLCLDSSVVSRGSCTDRDWNSPACAQQCTDENLDMGLTLINCDARLGTWICATGANSCGNDADIFPIDMTDMNQIQLRPAGDGPPITLTPNATDVGGGGGDGDNTTSIVTVTASASAAPSDAQFTSGQMAGVGAGVGVPLLLALLGAVFVIMRQRKRLRAAEAYGKENELKPTNHGQHDPHHQQQQQHYDAGGYGGGQQPMPYGNYAPGQEQKVQSSAAYYRPFSPSPPAGHFREVEPVPEMDGQGQRTELDVPK